MESKRERIEGVIQRLVDGDDDRLIGIWNRLANEFNEDEIYEMREFNEVMGGKTPIEVAEATYGDDFIPIETWFSVGWDGCAYSYAELYRSPIRADLLAEWAVSQDDGLGLPEVREILDEPEDEDEDEDEAA